VFSYLLPQITIACALQNLSEVQAQQLLDDAMIIINAAAGN
jgi:hypothetical protein